MHDVKFLRGKEDAAKTKENKYAGNNNHHNNEDSQSAAEGK